MRKGKQVPSEWWGQAHSVFTHAVNLAVWPTAPNRSDKTGGERRCGDRPDLLTLLDSSRNMGERCLVLPPALFVDWRGGLGQNLDSGQSRPVVARNGMMTAAGLPPVDFCRSPVWVTPWLASSPSVCLGELSIPWVEEIRHRLGPATHPAPWGTSIYRRFETWAAGGLTGLDQLVGAGPGLTPAGDDMLTGFLCGLHAAFRYGKHGAGDRLAVLQRGLPPLLTRTTDVSRCFLEDALAGRFHRPLARLCRALWDRTEARLLALPALLDDALAFGAGSGREGVYGLLRYLFPGT